MNYIAEINAFQDSLEFNRLSTGQIALWYALMHLNNKTAWSEWFSVANQVLEVRTGMSRKAILNARNALVQKGYISCKSNSTFATKYKMLSLSNNTQDTTQETTQDTTQETTQDTTQETTTLDKQNYTKRNGSLNSAFAPPTIDEVVAFGTEYGHPECADEFFNYYTSTGWKVGRSKKMQDWKASYRGWVSRQGKYGKKSSGSWEELGKKFGVM